MQRPLCVEKKKKSRRGFAFFSFEPCRCGSPRPSLSLCCARRTVRASARPSMSDWQGSTPAGRSIGVHSTGGTSGAALIAGGEAIDWESLTSRLPIGRDEETRSERKRLFERWDANGNKLLSLAEVDRALRDVMGLDELYSAKPVIMRAFQAAKDSNRRNRGKEKRNDDYVELDEFRRLLVYLRQYFELYVAFRRLDASFDGRITPVEFERGVGMLATWGIVVEDAKAEFAQIDADGAGAILFDEFCDCAPLSPPADRAPPADLHPCSTAH